ncbi:MAG: TerB family tellurite resistance protein [Hyphomicrobiales bacterium]
MRGQGLGQHFGARKIAGCSDCVRLQLLRETGRSAIRGWGSPAAAATNPVFLAYGVARSLIVTEDPARVEQMLREAGLPAGGAASSLVRLCYSLAATVIAADRRILEEEIALATRIGMKLFTGFREADFRKVVAGHRELPGAGELATLLRQTVDADARASVYRYLVAIASADGEMAVEEHALLQAVARNLGLETAGGGHDQQA